MSKYGFQGCPINAIFHKSLDNSDTITIQKAKKLPKTPYKL